MINDDHPLAERYDGLDPRQKRKLVATMIADYGRAARGKLLQEFQDSLVPNIDNARERKRTLMKVAGGLSQRKSCSTKNTLGATFPLRPSCWLSTCLASAIFCCIERALDLGDPHGP